jgi:4-amino-4-deoxy-L-arabinose transferase-like glycosyltransferase
VTAPVGTTFSERYFGRLLACAVAVGAAVRLFYVLNDHRRLIGGDGFDYQVSSNWLADGHGYTIPFGAGFGAPVAQHPPGWVTVLAVFSWLGARSQRDHQLVGVAIGIGVVVLAGLVGRRYFNARVGIVAAVLAALYPGFWLLEGNILSEPLGLFVVGILILAIAGLRERPTVRRSLIVGALCGLVALVRSEQLFLLPIVVAPLLISARTLSWSKRAAFLAAAVFACGVVLAPWTIYNATRFKDPVLLSTQDGSLLLIGNCPPSTYTGARLGYFDGTCNLRVSFIHHGLDRSQLDPISRRTALHNIKHNLGKMPFVVPARFGRLLAVYRPSQTVGFVAAWMTTSRRLIWAWVASYWLLLPVAALGAVVARRSRVYILPLVGPLIIMVVSVAISYGEPRYHTPSDLSAVVLAAVGIDRLATWRHRSPAVAPVEAPVDDVEREPSAVS